jgi:ribonucleotide monophosphatase NagD (HAD superfamily)
VLAIGDGVQTDVKGASDAGLDALFIAGGLAARETKTERDPDPTALAQFLHAEKQSAKYTIGFLR